MTRVLLPAVAVAVALLATLAVFGVPLGEGLRLIGTGAVGSGAGVSRSLVRATPLLLVGLGMVFAWRTGMYNIGGEGQYVSGGLAGAALASLAGPAAGPWGLLAASCVGGAAVAWVAGWLQVRRDIPAVISTILLNFIVLQLQDWLLLGPLQEAKRQIPQTDRLPEPAMLVRFDPRLDLHAGVLVAAGVSLCAWAFLFRTHSGFRMRVSGEGPAAARAHGIDAGPTRIAAMAVSGALCGLAGGIDYAGLTGYVGTGFDQGWGFLGIPVALLGGLHPLGVVASAAGFGAMIAGCENLARFTDAGTPIVYVVQGTAVLAIVAGRALAARRGKGAARA
jgi:simple sugar transport system permease protein